MNIGIVGLGLMGGSFGRAICKSGEHNVFGYDVNEQVMLKAQLLKAINQPLTKENANQLDVLIVAVFSRKFKEVVQEFLPFLKDQAIVIDFCGIKRTIISQMQELNKLYPSIFFIGGHPMAGREFSGIEHSQCNLFNKASMILVPIKEDIFVESKLKNLFLSIGCDKVVITDAKTHDKNIAYTSQLCHIVSSSFIKSPTAEKHFGFSAGSYKDMTRVARMNADMWAELVLDNSDYVVEELDIIINNLNEFKNAIASKNGKKVKELFEEGNNKKISIDLGRNKCKQ